MYLCITIANLLLMILRYITIFAAIMLLSSFSTDKVDSLLEKAYAAEDAEQYKEAIAIYEDALTMIPEDSITWISDINSSLLFCHLRLGQIQKGLTCGEKSLQLDEAMGDKERIASSLSNLASLLMTANRLEPAENYLLRSITLERELKSEDKLAIRLGMMAEVYTKMKQPEKALPLAKEALELDQKGGREAKAAIRMSQYGNALVCTKRSAEALPWLTKALQLHRKYENHTSEAITLATLGIAENDLHQESKAEEYLKQCIEVAQQVGVVQPLMTAHMELSHIYNDKSDSRAYTHLVKYNELKDSLASIQVQQQISDLEVKYETKQKEQELRHKELQIQRQRIIYIALAIVLMLVLTLVVFLTKSIRLKNQNMALKDHFMQIISHDLKNPAIAHQKNLHMLSKSIGVLPDDDLRNLSVAMAKDADAHVNLIFSLLAWAGLQTGRLHYAPIMQNLAAVAEDVITQIKAQATIKNINLVLTADDSDHLIFADREMVEAMIRNLLSNAIKFSNHNSDIHIRLNDTSIEIDDEGIGMDNDNNEKGTGLGLRLVRLLAEKNHATFTIAAKPDKGTLATIVFLKKG